MDKLVKLLETEPFDAEAFFRLLYENYRDSCCSWLQASYRIDYNNSYDIFQQAILVLFDKIKTSKVSFESSSQVKTYLYSIAKYIAMNKKRSINKWSKIKEPDLIFETLIDYCQVDSDFKEIERNKIYTLQQNIIALGESCRKLLTLFYYDCLDMKEIANQLNYSNASTAKAQKYKCMQRLKKSIKTQLG